MTDPKTPASGELVALREALEKLHRAVIANPAQTLWSEPMRDALTDAAIALAAPTAQATEGAGVRRSRHRLR